MKRFFADAAKILEQYYRENGDFTCGGLPYSRMREEIPRSLDKLQDAGKRIKRIVDDLKDFARQGDIACTEIVDLNSVAQAAVRLVEPSIRKATTRFSATYGEHLPQFCGNAQRIEQVLVNLILNACQALSGHGWSHRTCDVLRYIPFRGNLSPAGRRKRHISRTSGTPDRSVLHHQTGQRRHRPRSVGFRRHR